MPGFGAEPQFSRLLLLDNRTVFNHCSIFNTVGVFILPYINKRVKSYPDGSSQVLVSSCNLWGADKPDKDHKIVGSRKASSVPSDRAIRRARSKLMDYVLCNLDLSLFVTLTLDKSKVDRYDRDLILSKLSVWLDNSVQRRGLKYVLTPETHLDGAIHFHALFNDVLQMRDSGVKWDGKTVYNLPQWGYGFTTAIYLYGDRNRAAAYVAKYISKQTEKIGGRYYRHSNNLLSPVVSYGYEDFDSARGDFFHIEGTNLDFIFRKEF